jgi:hypothetical protein
MNISEINMGISVARYGAARCQTGDLTIMRIPGSAGLRRTAIGATCLLLGALCACTPKSAQEKGAQMAGEKIDVVTGIGDALTNKGGKAAESIATGVGTVVEGVERGATKVGRKVSVDPSLAAAGLTVTMVQDSAAAGADAAHSLQAYVVAKTAVTGNLRMFAYDVLSREIGRSSVPVVLSSDDAKYIGLPLDKQVALRAVARVGFTFASETQVAAK